jgi:hypothetical protein
LAGWETTSDRVNARKPVVGASAARVVNWLPKPGTSRVTEAMEVMVAASLMFMGTTLGVLR